jgi:hypothetical protein
MRFKDTKGFIIDTVSLGMWRMWESGRSSAPPGARERERGLRQDPAFLQDAIQRHKTFIDKEASAEDDAEALKIRRGDKGFIIDTVSLGMWRMWESGRSSAPPGARERERTAQVSMESILRQDPAFLQDAIQRHKTFIDKEASAGGCERVDGLPLLRVHGNVSVAGPPLLSWEAELVVPLVVDDETLVATPNAGTTNGAGVNGIDSSTRSCFPTGFGVILGAGFFINKGLVSLNRIL